MKRTCSAIVLMSLVFFVLTGCVSTPANYSGQNSAMQQAILSRLMQSSNQNQQLNQSQEPIFETISEEELKSKLDGFGELSQPVAFESKKDGFNVNGMRYVDPEGAIISYGFDVENGDVTYVVETRPKHFLVKYVRALSGQNAVLLATAERNGPVWNITTVTGQNLSGQSLTPLSCGFLVSRDTAGFIYEPGKGTLNIGVPDNFHIASFQNGEVLKTGYILLEKDPVDQNNKVAGLFDSVKSLGSSIGLNKKEDYVLFNVKSGNRIPINIDANGKNIAIHSECRQVNNFYNECAKLDHFESLYDKHGMPNGTHYFWRVDWFAAKNGTYLISEEGTKVRVTNIETGKQVVAFSRAMGINYVLAERTPDLKIKLRAKLGFSKKQIEDLEAFFSTAEDISKG